MKVILQPCTNNIADENYNNTVKNKISRENLISYFSKLGLETSKIDGFEDSEFSVWGVVNATDNANYKKWETLDENDQVIFSNKGNSLRSVLKLCFTEKSKELSRLFWKDAETLVGYVDSYPHNNAEIKVSSGEIFLLDPSGEEIKFRVCKEGKIGKYDKLEKSVKYLNNGNSSYKTQVFSGQLQLIRCDPWENLYFMTQLRELDISMRYLNAIAGYRPDYSVMGFTVTENKKGKRIIEGLCLDGSNPRIPDLDEINAIITDYQTQVDHQDKIEEVKKAAKELFGESNPEGVIDIVVPDKKSITREDFLKNFEKNFSKISKKLFKGKARTYQKESRIEQESLRNYLFFGLDSVTCDICKNEYPIPFMWASHIKPRSKCTNKEKSDYKNIVFKLCKFGCDDLYEKGVVVVDENGFIVRGRRLPSYTVIDEKLSKLLGGKVSNYSDGKKEYFKFHYDLHIGNEF